MTTTALSVQPTKAPSGFGLVMSPQSLTETRDFCNMLAKTEFVGKAFRNKPDSIMVVGAMGARLGVDVFTAMAGIADINGKPCVYGDLMMAVCQSHPAFRDCIESFAGKAYDDDFTAVCEVQREGRKPIVRRFSVIEAKEGGLWKKPGPWTTVPQRMLQMRARSFALRDAFSDALAGMHSREEMEDAEAVDVTASATVRAEPKPAKRRTVETSTESPAAVEPQAPAVTAAEPEPAAGSEVQAEPVAAPAKDLSVAMCQAEFGKLWKADNAKAREILSGWKIVKVSELAAVGDDDRESFLLEVGAALDVATGA
jgi:hypothetical protein